MRKGNKIVLRFCKNCSMGIHGKCPYSFCQCPLDECKHSTVKVSVLQEAYAFYHRKEIEVKPETVKEIMSKEGIKNVQ